MEMWITNDNEGITLWTNKPEWDGLCFVNRDETDEPNMMKLAESPIDFDGTDCRKVKLNFEVIE